MWVLLLVTLNFYHNPMYAQYLEGNFFYQAQCGKTLKFHRAVRNNSQVLMCVDLTDPQWKRLPISNLPKGE